MKSKLSFSGQRTKALRSNHHQASTVTHSTKRAKSPNHRAKSNVSFFQLDFSLATERYSSCVPGHNGNKVSDSDGPGPNLHRGSVVPWN